MTWQSIVYFSENVDYNNDFCTGYNISFSLHNKQSEFAVQQQQSWGSKCIYDLPSRRLMW